MLAESARPRNCQHAAKRLGSPAFGAAGPSARPTRERQSGAIHDPFLTAAAAATLMLADPPALRADTALDPAYLDGLEWRMIGPWRGGRALAVAGHASDPAYYVMGSVGGVFLTRDGGETWTPADEDNAVFGTASVGAVDIAPSDPNVIVVGMGESCVRGVASSHGDGIYRSTDGGVSWDHLGLEDTHHISAVRIHPQDPGIFWIAAQGHAYGPNDARGIYKTGDGGRSFKKVLFVGDTTGASDLKYGPANPRILYAAMWDWQRTPYAIRSGGEGSGLWKSADGGETWKPLTADLPELMGKIGVAPSPAKPGRVWALVEAKEKGGLYRSEDYGASWSLINGERRVQARSWYYMHVFADPEDADTVYVQNAPFLKSIDGGKSFERITGPHGDHHDLWINPTDPDIMIDANDGGATVTNNGGASWTSQHNQPTAQFYRVNTDNDLF